MNAEQDREEQAESKHTCGTCALFELFPTRTPQKKYGPGTGQCRFGRFGGMTTHKDFTPAKALGREGNLIQKRLVETGVIECWIKNT